MGVAPLPADKNSNFLRGLGAQVKWPWGPVMGKVSPTLRRSHSQLESQSVGQQNDSELLASLLAGTLNGTPSQEVPADRNHVPNQVPASQSQVPDVPAVPVTSEEVAKIASLLGGNSPSKVIKMLDGYHPRKYDAYKAKVDAVVVMLARSQTREKCEQPSCPDDPDPDEDVPPAFRGALE